MNEAQCSQLPNLALVNRGLEAEVELIEVLHIRQVCQLQPRLQIWFPITRGRTTRQKDNGTARTTSSLVFCSAARKKRTGVGAPSDSPILNVSCMDVSFGMRRSRPAGSRMSSFCRSEVSQLTGSAFHRPRASPPREMVRRGIVPPWRVFHNPAANQEA
jgi:hypothetical protein